MRPWRVGRSGAAAVRASSRDRQVRAGTLDRRGVAVAGQPLAAADDGRCGVPESRTGVAGATIGANAGREAVQEPVRSALWHRGRQGGLALVPSYPGGIPPVEVAGTCGPAPDVRRHCDTRRWSIFTRKMRPARAPITCRQRGGENEALTASAPVAGGRITDMVRFVNL